MTNSSGSRKPQVFINFRGKAQRNIVCFLKSKLEEISDINVFMDEYEIRGRPITTLFERIRESSIALVVFSNKYPESQWCLDELVEIVKQMEAGSLVPFPIFYKVNPDYITRQTGCFRNTLLKTEDDVRQKVDRSSFKSILETEAMIWGWRQALVSVGGRMGLCYHHKCDEDFVNDIVVKVKEMIDNDSSPRNSLSIIEGPLMHPQEAVMSLLQTLNLKKSDLEDPIHHINGVVSQSTDLVFLDLISLNISALSQRLIDPGQAGRILLVLLGSLEYYNNGLAFKHLFLPKKSQQLPGKTNNNHIILSCVKNSKLKTYPLPVQSYPSVTYILNSLLDMTDCSDVAKSNDNLRYQELNNSHADLTCLSFLCNILERCTIRICPPTRRVFINFGEKHLGKNLVSFLKRELESNQILVYVDDEMKSRIKESGVAIVVFSKKYPKSEKCLDELVEIKKLMDAGEIDPFPVFYNLEAESVANMKGWFRNRLLKIEDEVRKNVKRRDDKSILDIEAKIWGWRQALLSIALRPGLSYEHSTDDVFVSDIVTKVKELFEFRERHKNSIHTPPLMHRQETEAATTTVVKSLDDDLFFSLTSVLEAIDRDITDLEEFTDMTNGLVCLRLKGHTNLLFLKLSSHENLVRFQCSDSFKSLNEEFALNPSGVIRIEEPVWPLH